MAPGGAPPPPANNLAQQQNLETGKKTATTLSTIAVQAGVNASIVVALLKSDGYIQLRMDEMRPKLLAIGSNYEETSDLLKIHEDLLIRLRDKDDQVVELLNRTDGLGAEKTDEKEAIIYNEMAKSLRETWRSLNRQLILRSYLLRETLQFYKMASTHEKLTSKTLEIIAQINSNNAEQIQSAVDRLVNDIIDTTATVVELGSSVISQIRTLGQVDDNPDRPQEILESCVLIETVMLRVASDWERSENIWDERKNIENTTKTTTVDELVVIEQWLEYSEKRVKALNENGQKNVLSEGNKHVARLHDLAKSPSSDGGRISHLSGRIEEFLHYLKTKMGRSQRIQQFISAAKTMLSQLSMMVGDMKNANSAMAGELAPLAKQKASPLIAEGKDISAKEVMSYEEQRLVKQYVTELEEKLREIGELAKMRVESDKTNSQVSGVQGWLDGYAQAFLAQKGDMGGNLNDAREFVGHHKNFAAEVSGKDQEVMHILGKKGPQLSNEENEQLDKLAEKYESIKTIIENRIQIGTTYEQVHKFGKDLEGSFDALQTLLENNQEYTNEKVCAQIINVFQMIQETLNQEKHQGEKFISNATQIGKSDETLNIQRAQESVRNMITDHENRYKYVHHKWNSWQSDKDAQSKVEKVIEEIQMWQTDVLEFIGKADNQTFSSKRETEDVEQKILGFQNALVHNNALLEQLKTQTESEEQISRINVLVDKQEYIKTRLEQLKQKIELTSLLRVVEDVQIWQEEMVEIIRNLNEVVSTQINNQEQFEQARRKIEDLKVEVDKKSEHLEACRSISQNETYQTQLQKTIHNQETIQKTTHELQQKLEISQLIKVVQEVQMWQEEAIEIIRMFDRQEPKTIQDANELIDKVEEFKKTVEEKSKKIQEIKQISKVPEFVNKMEEVEHVQEQIHHLTVELEEKVGQQKLTKVTESIQMWQEEMIEIIKMFDSTPMKTIQECEELQEKVKLVREAIDIQQPKIEDVVKKATDINVRTHISEVIERQNQIRHLAEHLERKAISATIELSRPQQTVEESKTIELTSLETTKIQLTQEEKKQLQILRKTIEEVQMWQEDIIEIIRLVSASPPKTIQESESLVQRVNEISQTVEAQTTRIEEAAKFTKDEQHTESVTKTMTKQEQVKQLVKELHERAAAQNYVFREQLEQRQHIQAPQILSRLEDSEVDEGCKFEFAARIEGEPEPVITWLKDGIDVKSNIDYRQEYVNGVATLVIEESFIEDTARYTVKATNEGGVAESSASLIVKSRSAMSSAILEEDKPRFVKQLQNVQVTEGETARLDCVVVGKPEPEVTWFKEETAIIENERVHFTFSGDHCQMIIDQTIPLDHGVYTVKAKNVHGEVANFCQLRVAPKKVAPKPYQRPPSIQPALTNTVWEEGSTATLQVFTHGEPKPRVHWKFNDSPLQSSSQVEITNQEDGWSKVTIQQISPVHAGMYTAVAENEIGEAVTGATVHVQPSMTKRTSTTTEHHLQEEMNEKIGQPIQQTVVTKTNQEYEQRQRQDFPQPREPEKIVEDKRWVEVIEQHFEEHLSQKSMSPIPQVFERKKIETQQRWVDTIDEIWSPQPTETIINETRNNSRLDHFSSHSVHEPSPRPVTYQTTTTTTAKNISHIGQSHQPVQPVVGNTTTTNESVKTMNIATVRQSPQREVHEARTTPGPTSEHVAAIRKTPVRETHQSSITHAPSLENVAKIRQSPVPKTHRSTITRRSPSVENVAKIRQSPAPETHISTLTRRSPSVENVAKIGQPSAPEQHRSTLTRQSPSIENISVQQPAQQPESHRATTVTGQPIANIAQIHNAPLPEVRGVIKEAPKIDRIDDILVAPKEKVVTTTVEQTITTTGDIDKRYQEQEQQKQTTTTVSQGEEGWIQHKHQDFVHPEKSSIVTKSLNIDESENIRHQTEIQKQPEQQLQTIHKKTIEEEELLRQQQQKREPKTTTTVTETTSGEGWVQNVHQDMQQPHLSTVTVKKLGVEENELVQHNQTIQQQQQPHVKTTTKTREELEEEERTRQQSKIPVRREPVTTVTETTSGEGWVQRVHQQPETSTVTVKRLDIETGGSETKIPMRRGPRPVSIRQTDDETSIRQRDSFAAASEVEGFWTDGAYTASPTPPPQPIHRTTAEDNMQRIGLSRTTTEPEFIRFFEKEYTVEEGGRIAIECILVGNPKPWTRVFFNNRQITEKSEFLKICHVNDTYSVIISPARLEHAGYYKIIAENKRGVAESLTVLHVRPRSLQTYQQQKKNETLLHQQQHQHQQHQQEAKNSEFTTVEEEFAMFEYEQRRPLKHESSKLVTPPPAKRIQQEHRHDEEHLETYDIEGKKPAGHPPHFTQTLVSTVIAQGDTTKFEGIVTGWPAPTVEWTVDGQPLSSSDIRVSNIGGRVSLNFPSCQLSHAGKYMCTAKNSSGVATSSAQLVVRPKTVAPDFIQRLISEEIEEGAQLKWTVRVTGDPMPKVTWLRDGYEIPDCDEVRIVDHGDGYHSLIIVRVESADSGQFTCLAENIAGEARSTADLVVRQQGAQPGNYFHVTKVTQEKQSKGSEPKTTSAFAIETPRQSEML